MKKLLTLLSFTITLLTLTSHAQNASSLPLLTEAKYLGTTFYGTAHEPEDNLTRSLITDAVANGMNAFTFYVDWADLEPSEGKYDLAEFEANLAWLSAQGIRPYVNITLIDISDLNLYEAWLTEEGKFKDGLSFSDPSLIQRFTSLLDELIPILLEHGGFYLGLGNEVDDRFTHHPDELDDYLNFLEAARAHVHSIEPRLAVGVTVTSYAALQKSDVFYKLRSVTDIVPFDYYGLTTELELEDLSKIPDIINEIMVAYEGDVTLVQETNCPSAKASGSSHELQADCLDLMLTSLLEHPQIRLISVFSLSDFDDETCGYIKNAFKLEDEILPPLYTERLIGLLCETGMINPDGSPKPAWASFLKQAQYAQGKLD